jgi:hypothetical protein
MTDASQIFVHQIIATFNIKKIFHFHIAPDLNTAKQHQPMIKHLTINLLNLKIHPHTKE